MILEVISAELVSPIFFPIERVFHIRDPNRGCSQRLSVETVSPDDVHHLSETVEKVTATQPVSALSATVTPKVSLVSCTTMVIHNSLQDVNVAESLVLQISFNNKCVAFIHDNAVFAMGSALCEGRKGLVIFHIE